MVRYGPEPESPLESVLLFAGCVVPICTPEFAAKYNLSEDTRSLTGVPVIHVKKETSDPGWLDWSSWSKHCGVKYQEKTTIPEFPRLSSGLRAAKEDLGVVLCGMVESYSSLADGSMILPFGGSSAVHSEWSYRLLWACGRTRSKTQIGFRNWMVAQAESYRDDVESLLGQ